MILVDTDVLIAHLRGVAEARDWLVDARQRGPLVISVVTRTEVLGGMRSSEEAAVNTLLRSLPALDVTSQIADAAGAHMREFRASHSGIGLGDYLIAGTATVHGMPLATLNVRHFPMFPGLAAPFTLS